MQQLIGRQGTILIVEDDRNTAALVATYLEREGFTTVVIHDGGMAIQAAADCNPVFVILDIMLPNMDGREICRTLRKFSDVWKVSARRSAPASPPSPISEPSFDVPCPPR